MVTTARTSALTSRTAFSDAPVSGRRGTTRAVATSNRQNASNIATRTANAASPVPAFQGSLWDAFRGTPASTTTPATTANSRVGGNNLPVATSSPATGMRGGAVSTNGPAPRTEDPAPNPNAQLVSRVGEALTSIGLDPAQFNLRVGAMEIVFPGLPTYDYPVLWANIGGSEMPFYLQAAMQNPSMVAMNISGMMGRPVMHLI
jgi:hypothetical protein